MPDVSPVKTRDEQPGNPAVKEIFLKNISTTVRQDEHRVFKALARPGERPVRGNIAIDTRIGDYSSYFPLRPDHPVKPQ
jgi:hypothetical protein